MVRATTARVLVRLGGTYPTGWNATTVGALCTSADYIIDGYTNPESISTTSTIAVELAVDVVIRMMQQADMHRRTSGAHTGEGYSYNLDYDPLSVGIKERIKKLLQNSYYGMTTVDWVE